MNDRSLPATLAPTYFPLDELERMASAMSKSQLFGWKTPEQALAMMLIAQAEGQHPATIAQDYDFIQNKPARKTHSVLARYLAAGGSVEWHELTDKVADATFTPPKGAGRPLRLQWTLEMARNAKLDNKDNWKGYPRAMLRARLIAEGARATYPGAIGGMLVTEEAQDLPEKDVTAEGSHTTVQMPQEKKSEPAQPQGPEHVGETAPKAVEGEVMPRAEHKNQSGKPPAPKSQLDLIRKKAEQATITVDEIAKRFNLRTVDETTGEVVDPLAGISTDTGNAILEFIRSPAGE